PSSPPTGFNRSSSSAQGNFNYRQHVFNHRRAYYGQMGLYCRARNSISSPVNLRALSHAHGALTSRGQGVAPPDEAQRTPRWFEFGSRVGGSARGPERSKHPI
ncbi:hypothetical protein FQN60_005844, partial [Etheostoma spectabile]